MVARKKATSSSQCSASRPAAYTKPLQKLVDETRSFGRLPKQKKGDSAADRYERNLYMRLWRHKENLPEDLPEYKAEERRTETEERRREKRQVTAVNLFNAVKELGRYPKESRAKDDAGQKERKLAPHIRIARKKQLFTPEEERELDELRPLQAEADALDVFNFQLLLTENDFWNTY